MTPPSDLDAIAEMKKPATGFNAPIWLVEIMQLLIEEKIRIELTGDFHPEDLVKLMDINGCASDEKEAFKKYAEAQRG